MKIRINQQERSLPLSQKELTQLREAYEKASQNGDIPAINAALCEDPMLDALLQIDALNTAAKRLKSLSRNDYKAVLLLLRHNLASGVDEALDILERLECTGVSEMKDVARQYLKKSRALESVEAEVAEHFNYDSYARNMEQKSVYLKDIEGIIWRYDKERKCFWCRLKKTGLFTAKTIFYGIFFMMILYLLLDWGLGVLVN